MTDLRSTRETQVVVAEQAPDLHSTRQTQVVIADIVSPPIELHSTRETQALVAQRVPEVFSTRETFVGIADTSSEAVELHSTRETRVVVANIWGAMTTRNPSNQLSTQDELEALKQRPDIDDQQDIVPIGYQGIDGVRRAVQGDEDAPWLKTPPFESRTGRYVRGAQVPFITPSFVYAFLEPVDVNTRRLLNIWLAWTIPTDANEDPHRLSVLPQGRRDEKTNEWYTIAVINPTLTADFPTAGFGDRVFYKAELSTPVTTGSALGDIVFRTVLTFDVAIYTSFRLGIGSLHDDATLLDLDYSFSD